MAIVKFGAVITDSRGSIGGTTFKLTRNGNVMQRKSTPATKTTEKTTKQRVNLASLAKEWENTLTAAQRTAWRALAVANPFPNTWGDDFALSGIAFYLKTNLTLIAIEEATIADAPSDQAVTALATLTLTVTAPNTASLTFTPTPTPTDHIILLAASQALSPGIANYDGKLWHLTHGTAGQASPLNIASVYNDAVGDFVAGRQYVVSAIFVNATNGARSAPLTSAAIAS